MRRLRSIRFRTWILPALLGALALRALIPAGFMPWASAETAGFESTLCSTIDPNRPEKLEVPGEHRQHCEYCVLPLLGAPLAHSPLPGPAPLAEHAFTDFVSQIPNAPLARTQTARGPPRI